LATVVGISGVVGAYAQAYFAMSLHWPHSFSAHLTRVEAFYMAVSVSTTQGLGAIQPLSPGAKVLAASQMVMALVVILFVIAVAVGNFVAAEAD
jgi:hypothetical protein